VFVLLRYTIFTEETYIMTEENNEEFHNPIDKDKVAEKPGLLPYAHTVGGVKIEPDTEDQIKGQAITAMNQQTDRQLQMIQRQAELLAKQAKEIQERVEISKFVYGAEMGFTPVIGKMYYLYQRKNENYLLSMVSPIEWGVIPYKEFIAKVRLVGDHTWEVMETPK